MWFSWMLYTTTVGLVLGIAALLLERVALQFDWPRRFLWLGAQLGTLVLGAFALVGEPSAGVLVAVASGGAAEDPSVLARLIRLSQVADRSLPVLWLAGSLAIAAAAVVGYLTLRRRVARDKQRDVDELVQGRFPLWLTRRFGPLAMGFRRGVIVVPEKFGEWSAEERELILRHEAQHLAALDNLTLVAGVLAVVMAPWNLAVLWQFRRLAWAVELDCDRRVLRDTDALGAYSHLLLDIRMKNAGAIHMAPAFADKRKLLSKRLETMTINRSSLKPKTAFAASALAAVLFAAACETPLPEAPLESGEPAAEFSVAEFDLDSTLSEIRAVERAFGSFNFAGTLVSKQLQELREIAQQDRVSSSERSFGVVEARPGGSFGATGERFDPAEFTVAPVINQQEPGADARAAAETEQRSRMRRRTEDTPREISVAEFTPDN